MIPLQRPSLDQAVERRLAARTATLVRDGATTARARQEWSSAAGIRRQLRAALEAMAPGVQRCMYCGDGQGSSIDHFEPLARDPLKAFAWVNHLLACTHCNSNHKRDRFPVDPDGHCLLVDPTSEDPAEHLRLVLGTGEYRHRTAKGEATIDVFGLGRPELERGRAAAFVRCRSMLRDLHSLTGPGAGAGDAAEAAAVAASLGVQPFADVLHAMRATMDSPGAAIVIGQRELESLRTLSGRSG
ncbi:HNH endonuclease [Streptacidiphilus sp. N1-3]|uniref:HNH endonuclease n=1 Tax=Streptacidiphilus alkalitolerans TaxID=3342712 RepID=A0ABV6X461_9ACTN